MIVVDQFIQSIPDRQACIAIINGYQQSLFFDKGYLASLHYTYNNRIHGICIEYDDEDAIDNISYRDNDRLHGMVIECDTVGVCTGIYSQWYNLRHGICISLDASFNVEDVYYNQYDKVHGLSLEYWPDHPGIIRRIDWYNNGKKYKISISYNDDFTFHNITKWLLNDEVLTLDFTYRSGRTISMNYQLKNIEELLQRPHNGFGFGGSRDLGVGF